MFPQFKTILDFTKAFDTEQKCSDYLALKRWGKKPLCPHCGNDDKTAKFKDSMYYKCYTCDRKFTVRIGTVFGNSKIPLTKWFIASYLFTSNSKGISSVQLAKQIGVTQKSAWFMLHRLRHGMDNEAYKQPLSGIVEADETVIAGKPVNRHQSKQNPDGLGGDASMTNKMGVFAVVQRGGHVRPKVIDNRHSNTLQKLIITNVKEFARIITDEWTGYNGLNDLFFKHDTIKHKLKVYVQGDIHTQTIENFWSTLKRGLYGVYHFTSKKHLQAYLEEFAYRYNHRLETDSFKFDLLLQQSEAGQLEYYTLIGRKKEDKEPKEVKDESPGVWADRFGFKLPPDYDTNLNIGPY